MSQTVAIFGATGAQGAPVVREALSKGMTVRAVARDEANIRTQHPKAQAYSASLDDQEALANALSGVDAAFVHLPTPGTQQDPENWMKALFGAAHQVSLPHLVFTTSGSSGDRYPSSAIIDGGTAAMGAVLSSGIPSIVLQPTVYLENLQIAPFLPRLHSEGVLDYPPLPSNMKVTWTSHLDQARLAMAALSRPDLTGNSYEIGTPDALTGDELAKHISHWVGKPVQYQPVTPDEFGKRVGDTFGNPGMAFALTDLYGALAKMGDSDMVIDTTKSQSIFDVELTTVADHIKSWSK